MFEKAARLKLRFDSDKGLLTVEDLWDIPLNRANVSLNNIAKELHKAIKEEDDIDFVGGRAGSGSLDELKLDIVKHVIAVRLDERGKMQQKVENHAKKQKIAAILQQKEDQALLNMSEEDLRKAMQELD